MDEKIPMKSSADESYEKIPMIYNPMNQTTHIGKHPKDHNPLKFLWESFESKKPLEDKPCPSLLFEEKKTFLLRPPLVCTIL